MKKFRWFLQHWPVVTQWRIGAGKLLLVIAVGLLILASVLPDLVLVALGFLGVIVALVVGVLLYGLFKLRQFRRQMQRLGQTFSQHPGDPAGSPPQRPRQRVQCKVRDEEKRRGDATTRGRGDGDFERPGQGGG